jgi:hypothetical protein
VLASLTLLLAVAAPLTPVPWWAPLPVVVLLGAFVVHLRMQAIQRQRRRRPVAGTRARQHTSARSASKDKARAQGGTAAPLADSAPAAEERPASGFVSGPSRAVTVETKGRTASGDVTFEEQDASDEDAWNPNPLPLPTYVTAPKAVRPIKVIDLTTPGAWTSGRLLDDGLGEEDLLAAEVASDELDALLEHEAAPPAQRTGDQTGDHPGEPGRRAVGD